MPVNHRKSPDLIGRVFSRLTVKDHIRIGKYIEWVCYCSCGTEPVFARTGTLLSGAKRSCGCFRKEQLIRRNTKHGASASGRSPEYISWLKARARCTDQESKDWKFYGARGIKFLFKSFEQFFAELGLKPSPQHTLDRYPNNDGNYELGNVRWASKIQQSNNRRKRNAV